MFSVTVLIRSLRALLRRRDPKTSSFWRYCDPSDAGKWNDPLHRDGQLFRTRFRVPYPFFLAIVALLRAVPAFASCDRPDAVGQAHIPLELKVLACFRILGRGWVFDDAAEAINASECTIRTFFYKVQCSVHVLTFLTCSMQFIKYIGTVVFAQQCILPLDEEDIRDNMREYTQAGLPGCVGE